MNQKIVLSLFENSGIDICPDEKLSDLKYADDFVELNKLFVCFD